MKTSIETNKNHPVAPIEPLQGEIIIQSEPVSPKELSDGEIERLKTQARNLVSELETASSSREMVIIDDLTSMGVQAQQAAVGELDLLRTRMSELLVRKDFSAEISRDLVGLRLALSEINPHELSKPDVIRRLLGGLPFLNRVLSPARLLEMIAVRYETVNRQVQVIETRLADGRRLLARDNIELRKIYEQVEAQMLPVQKNAYLGEIVIHELDLVLADSTDPLKRERLRSLLHDVATRVQDLRTMEQVFIQFFVSIVLTRQNNTRLAQSIDRTLSLATNVVTVGLAIQTAMARQKRILEATQKTRKFLADMIAANATAIKQQTQEIGDVYNNPAIALDKVIVAHDQLVEALNLVDQLHATGVENARQNIARLTELSADLHQRAMSIHGITGSSEANPLSIEV